MRGSEGRGKEGVETSAPNTAVMWKPWLAGVRELHHIPTLPLVGGALFLHVEEGGNTKAEGRNTELPLLYFLMKRGGQQQGDSVQPERRANGGPSHLYLNAPSWGRGRTPSARAP